MCNCGLIMPAYARTFQERGLWKENGCSSFSSWSFCWLAECAFLLQSNWKIMIRNYQMPPSRIKPTNPKKYWRTLFSFHLITGWTSKCDLHRKKSSLPRRGGMFASEIWTKQSSLRGHFGLSINAICGLMITRHSTDISSQTLLDNRKVQEIQKLDLSPWGTRFVWPGNHTLSPAQKWKY